MTFFLYASVKYYRSVWIDLRFVKLRKAIFLCPTVSGTAGTTFGMSNEDILVMEMREIIYFMWMLLKQNYGFYKAARAWCRFLLFYRDAYARDLTFICLLQLIFVNYLIESSEIDSQLCSCCVFRLLHVLPPGLSMLLGGLPNGV